MVYDFSACYVNFTLCPDDTPLVDFFPALSAFDEFKKCKDENIIKLAIATADPESPIVKIKERDLMLNAIFEYLAIERVTAVEIKFYQSVLLYEHSKYLECFGTYLRVCHDIDWTEYQTTKQTYDVLVMEANRPKQSGEDINDFVKRRLNIQGHLKKVGSDLKLIEAKIFPDSRIAREIALQENKKIITYAERYAEASTYI